MNAFQNSAAVTTPVPSVAQTEGGGVAAPALEVRAAAGSEAVRAWRPAWDELFSRVPNAAVYLAAPWLLPFIETGQIRGGPLALGVWAGPRLVGLLTLEVWRSAGVRRARPLGTARPAEYGVLHDPVVPDVPTRLAEACARGAHFDVLEHHDVASLDEPTQRFLAALQARGARLQRIYRNIVRTTSFAGDFDAYLTANKSSKTRQTLRRKERKLQEAGQIAVERFVGSEVTSAVVDRIAEIQRASWMKRRGAAVLGTPFYRALIESLAAAGWARVWIMTLDGDDAAFVLATLQGGVLRYEYPAFKLQYEPLSIGQVLLQMVLRDCCHAGATLFDFGHGDAGYKGFWGTDAHHVERVFASTTWRGWPAAVALAAAWRLARNQTLRRWMRRLRGKPHMADEEQA